MGRRAIKRWTWIYLGLVAFSLLGSLFVRLTHAEPGWISPIVGALTILAGVVAVFESARAEGSRFGWLRLALLLVFAAMVEFVGVWSGLPFGRYAYTGRWWPSVVLPGAVEFPLLVPLAWLLMAGGAALTVSRLLPSRPLVLQCVLSGLLAAVLDVPMEPVMAGRLGYWRWLENGPLPGGAPLTNFLGWWITATLAAWILLPEFRARTWDATLVLVGQLALAIGLTVI